MSVIAITPEYLEGKRALLKKVKESWAELMLEKKLSVIINSQNLRQALGMGRHRSPVQVEDWLLVCSLAIEGHGLDLHLDAVISTLLQLTSVWTAGSICSYNTSYAMIKEKHAELAGLMKDDEFLHQVEVPRDFLPREETAPRANQGFRIYIQDWEEQGQGLVIIMEDRYANDTP